MSSLSITNIIEDWYQFEEQDLEDIKKTNLINRIDNRFRLPLPLQTLLLQKWSYISA